MTQSKAKNITGKIVKGLKYGLYIFCCLVAIFGYWILFTGNGIQTLVNNAHLVTQVPVTATVKQGSLYQGIEITDIRVDTDVASISIKQLALKWQPLALFSGDFYLPYLTLSNVEVSLSEQEDTEVQTDEPLTLPADITAGIPTLIIDQFRLDDLLLNSPGSEVPFQLALFEFKLNYADQQYHLYDARVSNDQADIKLDSKINVLRPFQSNINTQASIKIDENAPLDAVLKAQGDLNALTTDIRLHNRLQGHAIINLKDILSDLQWDARVDMDKIALRQLQAELPPVNLGLTLDAAGNLKKLQGKGRLKVFEDKAIAATDELSDKEKSAVNNEIDINFDFHGKNPEPEILNGEILIAWSDITWLLAEQQTTIHSAAGEIKLNRVKDQNTVTALTDLKINDIPFNLDLNLVNIGQEIAIKKLLLTNNEVEIRATGKFDQDSQQIELDSLWNIVDLEIPQLEERLNSSGNTTVTGSLDNYVLQSQAAASGINFPEFELTLPVKGNLNGLTIENAELKILSGKLNLMGDLSWQDQLAVNLNWQGNGFNPGELSKEWQGKLDTTGEVEVTRTDDALRWNLPRSNVQGSLRNLPLSLNLTAHSLKQGNNNIIIDGSYAEASVSVAGELGDRLNLDWRLAADDLSLVAPELGGKLNSEGQLSGTLQLPRIKATVAGKNILTPWASSEEVKADINADLSLDALINADILLKKVTYQETQIDDLEIKMNGRNSQHQFSLHSLMPSLEIRLSGDGALKNKSWTGSLSALELDHKTYSKWQLNQAVKLVFSPETIRVEPLCLVQSPTSLCSDIDLQRKTEQWQINASATELPLKYLQSSVPETITLNGSTQAQLTLNGKADRPIAGQGSISIPSGNVDIAITDDVIKTIALDQTVFEFKLADGLLTGNGELPTSGEDIKVLKTHFQIGDFRQKNLTAENLNIDAQLQAGIADLSLLTAVAPQIVEVKGSLDIDLSVKERLAHPSYDGTVTLANAGFSSHDLGIQIKEMNLNGKKILDEQYEIKGQMQSGDGILNLKTVAELGEENNPKFTVGIKGENFEVVNLPELWALINPEINGSWSTSSESFQGTILIPKANINLDELVVASSVSEDELIVNEKIEKETANVNRKINLKIKLGQAVNIQGKGISGNLIGDLALSTDKKGVLIGNGEILIDNGKYAAYGQDLVIQEGRVIYRNAALDDPIVSIVAVREVDDIKVGLKVTGYLTSPEVTLFSSRSLPQEQIISYIVFGRPLSSLSSSEGSDLIGAAANLGLRNSGMITEKVASTFGLDEFSVGGSSAQSASVSVGKYLNPKLYLSYGLGIFDKLSTVRLRYELSRRFSIETESGSEMGADIFYRIEK